MYRSSDTDRGRFSYMGSAGGPLWQRVTYWLPPPEEPSHADVSPAIAPVGGTLVTVNSAGSTNSRTGTCFFDWLDRELGEDRCRRSVEASAALPFDFWGGYVGYLGYELKAECGGDNSHTSSSPDAAMFLADRYVPVASVC